MTPQELQDIRSECLRYATSFYAECCDHNIVLDAAEDFVNYIVGKTASLSVVRNDNE